MVNLAIAASFAALLPPALAATQAVNASSSLIYYHGRWDSLPSSWWPGSGFKLAFSKAPTALTINVGSSHSAPPIPVSARFGDSGEWVTLNLTAGANIVPLTSVGLLTKASTPVVLDVITQMENADGRLELLSIELDSAAKLTAYKPKKTAFEFIGDSITAGFLSERGVVDDWAFKTAEYFHAEHNQIAQSGACLADAVCWGNPRGINYLYFQTQNSAYVSLNDNVTTAWDFKKYKATPTHIIINIGTNDNYYKLTGSLFVQNYIDFLHHLRQVYHAQPIFIISPWGYASEAGVQPYLQAEYPAIMSGVNDKNVHLVNATNWIAYGDTFPDATHPTPNGHTKIAYHMIDFLLQWGIKP